MDEGKLWARLVEWSAAAVRKPELLGPYADATGESVKRCKIDADDSALGSHEMEQQRAILKQMSQHIRFGAMNKDFFVDMARKYLPREEADEIMDFFLLGRRSERLKVSPRVGIFQEVAVEFDVRQRDSPEASMSVRRNWISNFGTDLQNGHGSWVPAFENGKPVDVLELVNRNRLVVNRIQLTFAPVGKMWSFATQPFFTQEARSRRFIVCRAPKRCFVDAIKIEPSVPVQNPARLTKIEVFGSCPIDDVICLIRNKLVVLPEAAEEPEVVSLSDAGSEA